MAGPVFYRQERVGYKGRPFKIWKFRTMVVNADKLGKPLTVGRDPRITRIGYWLRKFKLDELPQLLNVLLGEMSLVGPRPEVPQYVALYTRSKERSWILFLALLIPRPLSLQMKPSYLPRLA
jgi:lipopolysaccharide/colanic/teichoic acid biosynthesis glycosyltransferase